MIDSIDRIHQLAHRNVTASLRAEHFTVFNRTFVVAFIFWCANHQRDQVIAFAIHPNITAIERLRDRGADFLRG
ncbi:Uncharacterised protein [Vibrio cholerae]|nr:Uncharacterised protein [Vibrio cholerae]CSC98610.1 Uncharacterised protein [Vibrio cholerae]CSI34359.1 Uncharacterised protein [Vibrio cholerae]